jgi:hypothetical protein
MMDDVTSCHPVKMSSLRSTGTKKRRGTDVLSYRLIGTKKRRGTDVLSYRLIRLLVV